MTEQEMPEWLKDTGRFGMPEISDRDAASMLLPDLDYDAQLLAIHSALLLHREANAKLEGEIKELEEYARRTSGLRNQHAVDEWIDRLHGSVYQDAAQSMAAVGMIAPLIESIFFQAFQNMRKQFFAGEVPQGNYDRWRLPAEDRWNCHYVWNKSRRGINLFEGIIQMAEDTGLISHLPIDLKPILQALFEYRNKMFHCGFEWPVEERTRFDNRIVQAGWPGEWFSRATSDGAPWIFYMTGALVGRSLDIIEEIISGLGAFSRQQLAEGHS